MFTVKGAWQMNTLPLISNEKLKLAQYSRNWDSHCRDQDKIKRSPKLNVLIKLSIWI